MLQNYVAHGSQRGVCMNPHSTHLTFTPPDKVTAIIILIFLRKLEDRELKLLV